MWRWRVVAAYCLWIIDITNVAGAAWVAGGQVTNGYWEWEAVRVYHVALWSLAALLVLVPLRRG